MEYFLVCVISLDPGLLDLWFDHAFVCPLKIKESKIKHVQSMLSINTIS